MRLPSTLLALLATLATLSHAPIAQAQVAQVTGLTVTPAGEALELSWDEVSGATGYTVQWKSGAEDWDATTRQATVTDAEYTIPNLTPDTAYTVRVAATQTGADAGPWSAEATGTPLTIDEAALIALYNATGGDNWKTKTNWLSDEPLGTWHGVTTNDDGRVTNLGLSRNKLRGTIPAALGDLSELQFLGFQDNHLTGAIPPALSKLSKLRYLMLSQNALTGTIPPELGNMPNLFWLGLDANDLTGAIPPALSKLSNLTYLMLNANDLSGALPAGLSGLSNLQGLDLGFNHGLTGALPTGPWKALTELDLHGTRVCMPTDATLTARLAKVRVDSSGRTCGVEPSTQPVIDVAVFYTEAARRAAGSQANIETHIDNWVAAANQAYRDSGVSQRIELVARQEVEYMEDTALNQSFTDLDRLKNPSDGHLDEVHDIRNRVGADLVHLITGTGNVCGGVIPSSQAETRAFGLTLHRCGGLTFVHELGHSMGLSHDRYADCREDTCTRKKYYPYSYGYVNREMFKAGAQESDRWRTIMAYSTECEAKLGNSCTRVARFSDADMRYRGDLLGVPGERDAPGVDGPADAVRALNQTSHAVASFRHRPPPSFPATETGQRSVVKDTPAGEAIGAPVAADGAAPIVTLTYSLSGTDAGVFAIDAGTGQLRTTAALVEDGYAKASYSVSVSVHDGVPDNTLDATKTVTITVLPLAPAKPTVTVGSADPATTLTVSCQAPASPPPVTGYEVQLKRKAAGSWNPPEQTTTCSRTFTTLEPDTEYVVRVRAVNAGGEGPWSPEESVSTSALLLPEGSIPKLTVSVGDSTSAGTGVDVSPYFTGSGLSYAALSDDTDVATVSVTGATVTVRGEAAGSATITVTASDTDGQSAEQTFTVTVKAVTPCSGGMAGTYPCRNIDLMAFMPLADLGGGEANDIWGWTDSTTGKEYAIMGRTTGTAFVDVSDPVNPLYLGTLPPPAAGSRWRDIKVYADHAFIVTEASNSGMQVFDLTGLRTVTAPPTTFTATTRYTGFSRAHNLVMNETSGFAYAVGTESGNCGRGLHLINIQTPAAPTSAGCFSAAGYTHDAQCVTYTGPDPDYPGQEICFNANEDTLTIVDVTEKAAPVLLSRRGYSGSAYTHQGWLTEDQTWFLLGDELDEKDNDVPTRTYLWDVSDLDAPTLIGLHDAATKATDHNLYVQGSYVYQANYQAGLRILNLTDIANGKLSEDAFFDLYPGGDSPDFNGAWSTYPFFTSGIVIVSGIEQGLFILRPDLKPRLHSATVESSTLTLTYGSALDESSTPAPAAFSVTVAGSIRAVTRVAVSGRVVTLTLASAVTTGQTVTVTYTVPGTNSLQDTAGTAADGLSNQPVTPATSPPANRPPAFTDGDPATRSIAENTPAGRTIGAPVTATDPESDALTYILRGEDAGAFTLDLKTGQLRTFAALDYETKSRYGVTVTVHDGAPDATIDATIAVTIDVSDGPELPPAPAAPTVTADPDDPTRLTVSWTAVEATPAITGYQVQLKPAVGGTWTPATPPTQPGRNKTFTRLEPNTAYVARVRAVNAEGEGPWSRNGTGRTPADLRANAVTRTTARLTLANHSGPWSYQRTTPSGGGCTAVSTGTTATLRGLSAGTSYRYVAYSGSGCSTATELDDVRFTTDAADPGGPGPGGPGGGGGGGEDPPPADTHGNTPETATVVALSPAAPSPPQPGHLVSATDVDYFRLDIPSAGLLFVETTGPTDTVGRIARVAPIPVGRAAAFAPAGAEEDDDNGVGGNFRLGLPVTQGTYTVAVSGSGGATGPYALEVRLVAGYLENPGAGSFQSGIGVLSGWVCEAEAVELEITTESGAVEWHAASYGTERVDTVGVCGDTDNGFGVLFNWNRLGEGEHTVIAWVDGEELGRATVTVTTLGAEFLRGVAGTCEAADFPRVGETVQLAWQQNSQNFVIAGEEAPRTAPSVRTAALVGYLENPGADSFQSGVGVLSGWVCEAEEVDIEITTESGAVEWHAASYGTARGDTREACGDVDNGFGVLFNWNRLGDGEHTVVAWVDGEELGRVTVRVTTLGAEFLRGGEGECVVEDFPLPGQTVMLEWQQNSQNFVITGVE